MYKYIYIYIRIHIIYTYISYIVLQQCRTQRATKRQQDKWSASDLNNLIIVVEEGEVPVRVDSGKRFALGRHFRHVFTCLNKQALHCFQSSQSSRSSLFPVLSLSFSCFGTGGAPDGIWRDLLLSRYIMENRPESTQTVWHAKWLNAPSFGRQHTECASHLAHGWRLQQTWSAPQQTPKWAGHLCRADTSEFPSRQNTTTNDEFITILLSHRGFAPVVVVDHCSQSLPTYQNHSRSITHQIVLLLSQCRSMSKNVRKCDKYSYKMLHASMNSWSSAHPKGVIDRKIHDQNPIEELKWDTHTWALIHTILNINMHLSPVAL